MKTVYLVMGTTGEYSDRTEWPVKAYLDKGKAEQHVEQASKKAAEIDVTRGGCWDYPDKGVNPFDPNMHMDYTGTDYFYYEAELEE